MKVLFIVRDTLHTNKGGDTIQVQQTASHLEGLGVRVDVVSSNTSPDYTQYDLLHFFNLTRPADILSHIERSGKPYVLSPIFVEYAEFDRTARKGLSGVLFRLLPAGGIEYAKVLARAILKKEKIISWNYLWYGQSRSIKKILKGASMLLPNSQSEYRRIMKFAGKEYSYRVIPNAVSEIFLQEQPSSIKKEEGLILCVARIEGLKNQLNLIKALNNTRYSLLLIGHPAVNQYKYFKLCKATAAANIKFIDHIPQQELISYYRRARVHVLPSWFETTGLSSLEAASMDCNIVITDKGDTREYFENFAYYCDPASPESIFKAVEKAEGSEFNEDLRRKIFAGYTWSHAARQTLDAYLEVIDQPKHI